MTLRDLRRLHPVAVAKRPRFVCACVHVCGSVTETGNSFLWNNDSCRAPRDGPRALCDVESNVGPVVPGQSVEFAERYLVQPVSSHGLLCRGHILCGRPSGRDAFPVRTCGATLIFFGLWPLCRAAASLEFPRRRLDALSGPGGRWRRVSRLRQSGTLSPPFLAPVTSAARTPSQSGMPCSARRTPTVGWCRPLTCVH